MKPVRKKEDFQTSEQIWNEVINLTSLQYPTDDAFLNEMYILITSYNELESGGHEGMLNWNGELIRQIGIDSYITALTRQLQLAGADSLAALELEHGATYWRLFLELEKGEIEEDAFYEVIQHVDKVYFAESDRLRHLLQAYFNQIYPELFTIID